MRRQIYKYKAWNENLYATTIKNYFQRKSETVQKGQDRLYDMDPRDQVFSSRSLLIQHDSTSGQEFSIVHILI